MRLKVTTLGTCPGRSERAYKTLMVRYPQWPGGPLGSWRKWSGSRTMCDYNEEDPRYAYPKLGPGLCQTVGEYGEPGAVQSIATYRTSCKTARRAASRIRKRNHPLRCVKKGCTMQVVRMQCKLHRVRSGETTGGSYPYPVQRLSCQRGSRTMSAFLVLNYD